MTTHKHEWCVINTYYVNGNKCQVFSCKHCPMLTMNPEKVPVIRKWKIASLDDDWTTHNP